MEIVKSFIEHKRINEAKDLSDMMDRIEYAKDKNTKLPAWQDMVKFLESLNGIEIDQHKGTKYIDKKADGAKYVSSRHETSGTYVTVKFRGKTIFDQHTSEKTFTFNLGQVILNLAE